MAYQTLKDPDKRSAYDEKRRQIEETRKEAERRASEEAEYWANTTQSTANPHSDYKREQTKYESYTHHQSYSSTQHTTNTGTRQKTTDERWTPRQEPSNTQRKKRVNRGDYVAFAVALVAIVLVVSSLSIRPQGITTQSGTPNPTETIPSDFYISIDSTINAITPDGNITFGNIEVPGTSYYYLIVNYHNITTDTYCYLSINGSQKQKLYLLVSKYRATLYVRLQKGENIITFYHPPATDFVNGVDNAGKGWVLNIEISQQALDNSGA